MAAVEEPLNSRFWWAFLPSLIESEKLAPYSLPQAQHPTGGLGLHCPAFPWSGNCTPGPATGWHRPFSGRKRGPVVGRASRFVLPPEKRGRTSGTVSANARSALRRFFTRERPTGGLGLHCPAFPWSAPSSPLGLSGKLHPWPCYGAAGLVYRRASGNRCRHEGAKQHALTFPW
jgi:hypothetical protein